jgi:hypothetical protein
MRGGGQAAEGGSGSHRLPTDSDTRECEFTSTQGPPGMLVSTEMMKISNQRLRIGWGQSGGAGSVVNAGSGGTEEEWMTNPHGCTRRKSAHTLATNKI